MKQMLQKLFILLLSCLCVSTYAMQVSELTDTKQPVLSLPAKEKRQDEVKSAIKIIFDSPDQIDIENLKYEDVIKAYKDRKSLIKKINSITEQNRATELRMLLNAYTTILNVLSDKYAGESFVDHRIKIAQALQDAVQESAETVT